MLVSTAINYDLSCKFELKRDVFYCSIRSVNLVDDTKDINIIGTETELISVRVVSVVKSKVTFIPLILFKKFKNVEYLWLQEVGLERVDEESLKNAEKLKEIKLANNLIKSLPARTFGGCTDLGRLSCKQIRLLR